MKDDRNPYLQTPEDLGPIAEEVSALHADEPPAPSGDSADTPPVGADSTTQPEQNLDLQEKMSKQSQAEQAIANAMKTKHDAAGGSTTDVK